MLFRSYTHPALPPCIHPDLPPCSHPDLPPCAHTDLPIQPSPPALTQPSPPALIQPSPPVLTQPSPPVLTQPSPPALIQPSSPALTQPSPPALTQLSPPALSQPSHPALTQPSPPVLIQPSPPALTQPPPPALVQPSPPALTQTSPPALTQTSPPVLTQTSPPAPVPCRPPPLCLSSPPPLHLSPLPPPPSFFFPLGGWCSNKRAHACASAGGDVGEEGEEGKAESQQLEAAVHLSVASSFMSYAYTLRWALSNVECMRAASAAADLCSGLVVCILGASEQAELAHLDVWKVRRVCRAGHACTSWVCYVWRVEGVPCMPTVCICVPCACGGETNEYCLLPAACFHAQVLEGVASIKNGIQLQFVGPEVRVPATPSPPSRH